MEILSHDELTQVVVRLWAIWHARRKEIHQHLIQIPLSTHYFIERFITDLEMLKPIPKMEQQPGQVQIPKWIPPPSSFVKINVDATMSKNSNTAVMAGVALDAVGNFLGASAVVLKGVMDAETAEALACREGLALASDLLVRKFRLVSDC